MTPKLIFVGGFLGAGKTTLILKAAEILQGRGQRVAVIMNDQDSELVDTKHARARHFETGEVAGGCFCCRFSELLDQAKQLRAYEPDVIFAEPVGSCIDLAATILRPFQAFHRDLFVTAPLTVLIDPEMFREEMADEVDYLYQQQIREADIVCSTKADRDHAVSEFPFPVDFHVSARFGTNVELWLDEVLGGKRVAGARLLDVDYQEYAEAEAALGWLNVHASVVLKRAVGPAEFVGPLLERLDEGLSAAGIGIAHLKLFDQTRDGYLVVTIRRNGQEPEPQGDLISEASVDHKLAINLRGMGDAEVLRGVVEKVLLQVEGSVDITHCRAFQPLPPRPEYRMGHRFCDAGG